MRAAHVPTPPLRSLVQRSYTGAPLRLAINAARSTSAVIPGAAEPHLRAARAPSLGHLLRDDKI